MSESASVAAYIAYVVLLVWALSVRQRYASRGVGKSMPRQHTSQSSDQRD